MSNPQETGASAEDRTDKQPKKEKPKKKYEASDYFLKDSYVDCKDSVNSWCVGRILERSEGDHTIRVNFDGWSHKWDEWFRFTSSKVAPFRKYSVGYTGQSKFAIRDFKFSVEEIKQKTEQLREVVASDFTSLTNSFEITQYLRGSEYVYIDCLLQYEYRRPKDELNYVFKYFKVFFQAYVKFLKLIPDYIPEYLEGMANPDAFLTNPRIALIHSLSEMSESFNKILGWNERLWTQFGVYDSESFGISICESDDYAGRDITTTWTADAPKSDEIMPKKREKKHSELICQLVNLFGKLDGFEAWLSALTYHNEEQPEAGAGPILPPFKIMITLLTNIQNILVYLNKGLHGRIFPAIKTAITRRLGYISDKEIKDLDRDILVKFLSRSQALLVHYYPQDDVYLLTETAELDLSLRFLTCPYFEKRLRGINEIKELTEKIDMYEHFERNPQQYSAIYSQKMTKRLSAKMFLEWIDKNKIFELILGDSIHIEIIKRTHEILKFLAKYESLPLNLLDLIWNARIGKHEAIAIGIDNLIIEIADILDEKGIEYLKKKIDSIPDEEQNELTLNLIKGFALKTLPSFALSTTIENDEEVADESKFHCIDTLWHLLLDESKVTCSLSENALFGLAEILKERPCQALKKVYLNRCFEKIKKRDSVSQCLNLVYSILNNTYQVRYDAENSLATILEQLDTEYDLIELAITEFEDFIKRIRDIFAKRNTDPAPEEKEKVYFGKYTYSINFYNRLVFLEYLLTNQAYELSLTIKQIERLWDLIALNAIFESDRESFLDWISKSHEGHAYGESASVITKEVIPDFFAKILCNHKKFDFINVTPKAFDCFQTYYKVVNEIKGNFKPARGTRFIVVDLDYEGKESLWSLFLNCKNQSTVNKVVSLLVKCNLRLGQNLDKQKRKVCEEFTYKCMGLLKEGYQKQNDRIISKAVLLLMHFFDSFEGKNRLDAGEGVEKSRYSINMSVTIVIKPENTVKPVSINSSQTIGHLKNLISETFGIPLNEFKLSCKGSILDSDEDDTPLSSFPFGGPYFVNRIAPSRNDDNNFHPKLILTQNAEYIDLLFKLLSEDIQAVNAVWDLLIRLPVNEKIRNSLYEINDSWENLLEVKSHNLHRLLYCLQIIEDFLVDKEGERMNPVDLTQPNSSMHLKNREWMQKFYKSGGLRTFVDILLKPEMSNLKSGISVKCLTIILKICCYFFTSVPLSAIVKETDKNLDIQIIQRIVTIIHNACEYSLIREKTENESNGQPLIKVTLPNHQEPVQIPENLYFESELISYAQTLLVLTIKKNPSLLKQLYEYSKLEAMLAIGLIESNNAYLKEKLAYGVMSLLIQFQEADVSPSPHQFFIPVLLQSTLDKALTHQDKSEVFFRMLTHVVNNIKFAEVNLDVDKLLGQLVRFIKERKPKERTQKDYDVVLQGILQLLKGLFARFPEKVQKYGQEEKLVKELLQNCLFEIATRTDRKQVPGPKCKNQYSRYYAFKLLLELAKGSNENLRDIINYIAPVHRYGTWRTKRYVDWNITSKDNEKSSTGYVGLKNLGCICYMNSTVQQLYMVPSFRKAILEVEDRTPATTPKEDNILYQLKCIFAALDESEKQYFNPKAFCHAFKDWDGNPTNVYEQMDADEFFNTFMDRVETQIKGTKQEHSIKNHFGGVVSNELICKGCPHYSEREEPFLTVSLQVKNKKSIDQSLAAFVEGEMLEGDNAYHCAICDKKVNTLKRVCLKKLPNHLILVLKRFEFDFDTMAKVKVNDYCEFPMKLNIEPYTQQGLRKAEKAKKQENEQNNEQNQQGEVFEEQPPSYFEYKLTGVVIHLGFADSGHYYSLIQDRDSNDLSEDKRWYEFNDHLVSGFDPKDIPSEAFGGEEKWKYYPVSDNMSSSYKEKIKNAYLLFYERIVHYDPEEKVEKKEAEDAPKKTEESKEDRDESQPKAQASERQDLLPTRKETSDSTIDTIRREEIQEDPKKNIPQEFLQNLKDKNLKFQMHRNIFSREYFDFVEELVTQNQFSPNSEYKENYVLNVHTHPKEYYDLELLKLGVLFLLTAVVRDKQRLGIIKFLPFVKQQLSQNVAACLWLLDMFSSKKLQLEFFLDCPVQDMQRFCIGLITVAYRAVYEHEGKSVNNRLFETDTLTSAPSVVLANFTNCCISLIFTAKENNRDYTEFFRLFCEMIACGPEVAEYLISKKVIGRLMDFFYEGTSPLNDFFRNMTDVTFKEPINLELGQPQEEKKRIRAAWEEIMLKRKERQLSENHNAQKTYVWKTVCMLLLYCKIGQHPDRCEWQIGDYDCEILPQERSLLRPEAKFIEKVIRDAQTKIGYRSVAQFYSYLCYEDPKFSVTFMKAIQSGMSEGDSSYMKAFMRAFKVLLTLNDSRAQERCGELCEFLCDLMYENNKYYVEMDTYTTFLVKLLERVPRAREWFVANPGKLEFVLEWLDNHQVPPLGMFQGNIGISKKRLPLGSSGKSDAKVARAKTIIKANKIKAFLHENQYEQKTAWDSDDDLADHEFIPGEQVDFRVYPSKDRWVTAEVESILEEMISLSFYMEDGEEQRHWVSKDSENVAAHRGMQIRQEEIDQEIEKLETGHDNTGENQNDNEGLTDHDDSHKGEEGGTDNSSDLSMS